MVAAADRDLTRDERDHPATLPARPASARRWRGRSRPRARPRRGRASEALGAPERLHHALHLFLSGAAGPAHRRLDLLGRVGVQRIARWPAARITTRGPGRRRTPSGRWCRSRGPRPPPRRAVLVHQLADPLVDVARRAPGVLPGGSRSPRRRARRAGRGRARRCRSRCWRRRGRCRGRSRAPGRFCAAARTPSLIAAGARSRRSRRTRPRTRPARCRRETIITLSRMPPRRVEVRSARIERSQVARWRSCSRPVRRVCRRSSVPRHLPTIAIPTGRPTRTSRYGPDDGRELSASCAAR